MPAAVCGYLITLLCSFLNVIDQAEESSERAESTGADADDHLITLPLDDQSELAVSMGTRKAASPGLRSIFSRPTTCLCFDHLLL